MKLLFLLLSCGLVNIAAFLCFSVMDALDQENFVTHLAFRITIAVLYTTAQFLVFSKLFFFGCCVSACKEDKKYVHNNVMGKQNLESIEFLRRESETFSLMKESMSLALFLIFSLITVTAIFFVFNTISQLGNEGLFYDLCSIFWCFNLCLILIYLALVADEIDELRIDFIGYMW